MDVKQVNNNQQGESKMTNYTELAKDKIETLKMLAAIYSQGNLSDEDGKMEWQNTDDSHAVCVPVGHAMRAIDEEIAERWFNTQDPIEWIVEEIGKERQKQADFEAAGCQHEEKYPCSTVTGNDEDHSWCEFCAWKEALGEYYTPPLKEKVFSNHYGMIDILPTEEKQIIIKKANAVFSKSLGENTEGNTANNNG
jgi:Zn ribbon nucleic-acid-binding protein